MSKPILLNETEGVLLDNLSQLSTRLERREALHATARYLTYLDATQRIPLITRLRAYRMMTAVTYYLMKNRQLGRRTGAFDRDVKQQLQQVLSKLLADNGNDAH